MIIKEKEGYKVTKIGFSPEDWELKSLKNIAEVIMGQSPEGETYNYDEIGIPLINGPVEFTNRYPIKRQWTSKPTKLCKKEDILICVRGSSTGRINIANEIYCIGRGIAAIRAKEKFNNSFIEYNLIYNIQNLLSLSTGSTFPSIDRKKIEELLFYIPPFPEQEKIANILSCWDKAIEKKKKLIIAKQKMKKALMQQILIGKKRFKNFVKSNEYKKSKIGLIPKDWDTIEFSEIFERITFKNNENNQNVLTISAQQGLISQLDFFNKSVSARDLKGYYLIQKGDFAYNKSYSNGYPMGVIKKLERYNKGVVSTLYICFSLKNRNYISEYYEHYFESGYFNNEILGIAKEGGRAHGLLNVGINEFFALFLPSPIFKEQQKIAEILSTCDKEIVLLKKELEVLKNQKKGLMQKLLTGKIRVKIDE